MSMLIVMLIMSHAGAKGNNPNTSRGVDQVAAFARALHRVQQALFPACAVDEDHVSFRHGRQVARRGNKTMLISANRKQRTDLGVVARYVSRHISQNAVRRHNMQLTLVGE